MKPAFDSFAEPKVDRRKMLLGLLFCSAAGAAAWLQPRKHLDYLGRGKLENIVPKAIGPWNFVAASGLVVPPADQLRDSIYSQLLTRVYAYEGGLPVMLLIAQSGTQTGVLQVHRPEYCYAASGYQVSKVAPHLIDVGGRVIRASGMEATSGGNWEHVVYWTRVGNRIPVSWADQKLAVAELNLQGIIPDAILVRVSCVTDDPDLAGKTIDQFIRTLLASVPANSRSVFITE
jgi:EpsI family protein